MKAKQRGLRRKCESMVQIISEQTQVFPQPHDSTGFWHLHLPVSRGLVDSTNTRFGVRRLCVQTLVNRAQHLASIAPMGEKQTRVVVAISLPNLSDSQIIVFFGSKYFETFFKRNTTTQQWTQLKGSLSLVREWNLLLPNTFSERGYHEEINEPDFHQSGEIWFIGQLRAF